MADTPPHPPMMGAVANLQAKAHNLPKDDAIALLAIRDIARESFVEAASPLVAEIRRLRALTQRGADSLPATAGEAARRGLMGCLSISLIASQIT